MIKGKMIKRAYITQMTYDVSDSEKIDAERALMHFSQASKYLNLACDHLNIMKDPFKENQEMSPKDVMDTRPSIRRFRDKSVENFNEFKEESFKCVNIMQGFASDTQTIKLVKSFISSIDDLETRVNKFVALFDNLESKDFAKNIIEAIESIQKQCDEVDKVIDDRIKNHIQSNILATSWVDSVGNNLQMKIEKKTPLILELFNKRQDQLNEVIKEKI